MSIRSTRAYRSGSTDHVTFYPRIFGSRGAIAAKHYSATLAGIEILRLGGDAVDAACAATLVEGVVNQQMHSIGGELPILISAPDASDVVCINGNMVAPGKATPQAFRDLGYREIPSEGILAAGVPGAFGAIIEALSFCNMSTHSTPWKSMDASSLATLVQMVGAGLGVTLVPEMAVAVETRSAPVSIAHFANQRPSRTVGMIWRKTSPLAKQFVQLSKVIRHSAAQMREQCSTLTSQSRLPHPRSPRRQ